MITATVSITNQKILSSVLPLIGKPPFEALGEKKGFCYPKLSFLSIPLHKNYLCATLVRPYKPNCIATLPREAGKEWRFPQRRDWPAAATPASGKDAAVSKPFFPMTQTYEMLYIIPQNVTEEKVPEVTAKVDEILQRSGAKITRENSWGRKKFAYPIKHQRYGTYQLVYFELEPEQLPPLERELRLRQEILRHLIVKYRVRTAQEIAEHEERVARIAESKKRRKEVSEKAPETAAPATGEKTAAEAPKEKGPVDIEELDKKIDKLLGDDLTD